MNTTLGLPDDPHGKRVVLPLIHWAHPAAPDEELTPDRIAEILDADDARATAAGSQRVPLR